MSERSSWRRHRTCRIPFRECQHRLTDEHILTFMLRLLLPIYTWWQLPYYYAGCKLYDFLAGSQNMETAYWMGRGKALEAFPMLKSDGLVGGVVYYDGQHNDSRMNVSLIMTAVQHGAVVTNYTEVIKVNKAPSAAHGGKDRIVGVRMKDRMTGEEWDVKCKVSTHSFFV